MLNLCRRIRTIFDDPRSEVSEKRAILNFIFQNPTVDGKKLVFTMRKPFDVVLELAACPNWLPRLDEFRTRDWEQIVRSLAYLGLPQLVAV